MRSLLTKLSWQRHRTDRFVANGLALLWVLTSSLLIVCVQLVLLFVLFGGIKQVRRATVRAHRRHGQCSRETSA